MKFGSHAIERPLYWKEFSRNQISFPIFTIWGAPRILRQSDQPADMQPHGMHPLNGLKTLMLLIPITACERNSDDALVTRTVVINVDAIVSIVKYTEGDGPHILALSGGDDILVPESTVTHLLAMTKG